MQLTLGFSPCPNDTFIFDALVHQKIDTEGLRFEVALHDVATLNQKALEGELDITKLSYNALAHCATQYILLNAGSALGNNCGPLLVAPKPFLLEDIAQLSIAIPGEYTTANFLLSMAFPTAKNKSAVLFSSIEEQVLSGTFDAGLIIHENRFTCEERGLHKLLDLGAWWERSCALPIPLGGIACRRSFDLPLQQKIDRVLKRSITYAFEHPKASESYVRAHAQEMDYAVMQQHIALYVNDYTLDLGVKGRSAVEFMFSTAQEKGLVTNLPASIFIPVSS